ncbi:Sin-like protein conserved region [Geosmithia morbida]|uniref:Sin-like protein conserved region n=1 Tax=Geosmithia morbida TaxID=1094350 RepID=A0A9P4Z1D3_9HYPO|nr:Sin-like protein conserved region [Geosmithia morbida]KAF4126908.1 Sin-like protein conserved region [Geosmithia morbida]
MDLDQAAPDEQRPPVAPANPAKGSVPHDDVGDDDDDDDDPITATYPVFLNPSLPFGRRLLVLQHPNRTDEQPRPPPTELRLKARTGMVEVDMPLDSSPGVYDREKGVRWGRSLNASMTAKNGGSHGLAGGFGFGAVQQRGGAGRRKSDALDDDDDDVTIDWNEAVRQGKALTTQTLGGQYPEVNDVQYMVGVFQGKNLHLTPASSLVHLRPQLHHIDASTQLERRTAGGDSGGAGAGAGGVSGASGAAGASAKAIHMTVKTTSDTDGVSTETMADRLRAAQSEHWRKLRYTDENDEAAWEVYNESLFLQPKEPIIPAATVSSTEKGKGKEKENGEGKGGGGEEEEEDEVVNDEVPILEGHVPNLVSRWEDEQLLEAVSGIRKRKDDDEADVAAEVKTDPEARRQAASAAAAAARAQQLAAEQAARSASRPTRPRGGAAAGARRGARKA